MSREKQIDAVFEGGGVKGIGLAGAITVTQELGYQYQRVAGTSAGAITAALIAAGYRADRIKDIVFGMDYRKFMDPDPLNAVPLLGPLFSVGLRLGEYRGAYFLDWMRSRLNEAPQGPVRTFADLRTDNDDPKYRYRLKVIATDVTRGKMLVLPDDAIAYGIEPDELEVAMAVRMSMSIPYFFEPVKWRRPNGTTCYIVDGGVLSNYPVWLFDRDCDPRWPTIGYNLVEPDAGRPHKIRGPVTLFAALFSTMMEAHDARYIKDDDFERTIPIPTLGVNTTEFDISDSRKEQLFNSGRDAAKKFFTTWDFTKHAEKRRCR